MWLEPWFNARGEGRSTGLRRLQLTRSDACIDPLKPRVLTSNQGRAGLSRVQHDAVTRIAQTPLRG